MNAFAADLDQFLRALCDPERFGHAVTQEVRAAALRLRLRAGFEPKLAPWICSVNGRHVYPFGPAPEQVCIDDIAHALSMLPRFGGHARHFYSVAQHCVMVSKLCDEADALQGLLHDAREAYLLDVPAPIKPFFPGYAEAEQRMHAAICDALGVSLEIPPSVKRADALALELEHRELMPDTPGWPKRGPWQAGEPMVIGQTPAEARVAFLRRYRELTAAKGA